MISIQNFIYSRLAPAVLSNRTNPPFEGVSALAIENFRKNYTREQSKSILIGSAAYLSAGLTIGFSISRGITSLYTAISFISSIAFGCIWHKWANQPFHLTKAAFEALGNQNEKGAIEAIQHGANLDQCWGTTSLVFPFFQGPIPPSFTAALKCSFGNTYLLAHAVKYNCKKVITFLAALGWDLNQIQDALRNANSLETAQLLIDLGAKVNLAFGNPIAMQILELVWETENVDKLGLGLLRTRTKIIQFLIDHWDPKADSFIQNRHTAESRLNDILAKLDSFNTSDTELKGEIRFSIEKILTWVFQKN